MGFADLLRGLRKRDAERQQTAAESYADLVLKAADDQPVKEELAAEILHAANRSPADFERDVRAEHERRRLRALAGEFDQVKEQLAGVHRSIVQEAAAFEAQQVAYAERTKQLRDEERAINKRLAKSEEARRKLIQEAPVSQREADLRSELAALKTVGHAQDGALYQLRNTEAWKSDQLRIDEIKAELDRIDAAKVN